MSERPATRLRAAVLAAPWMMTQEMVETVLSIADRENLSPEAVAAVVGRPLDNSHAVEVRDGVAIIPVDGVIARHTNLFSQISGGVSIETLATDLHAALADPTITGIVLNVDSPGGEANGVGEFAAMVRAAHERKPVVAYVGGTAASAGYYLASAAGEVVVAADAILGNIGVVMGVPDPDKRASRTLEFVSSQSPHKRPDPRTEGGRSRLQATVDALADVFIGAVAGYRGLTPDAVAALGGDVLIGQAAIAAGLADRLGSFEAVVAELQQRARTPRRIDSASRIAAQHTGGEMTDQQGRMQRFMAWLGGEGDDSAFTAANIAASGPIEEQNPPPVAASSAAEEELTRLRDENTRLRQEAAASAAATLTMQATEFADGLIRDARLLPAQRDALIAAYQQSARADAALDASGAQTPTLDALRTLYTAAPAHRFTEELVPATATIVTNRETTGGVDEHGVPFSASNPAPVSAERKAYLHSMTPEGRALLDAQRKGK